MAAKSERGELLESPLPVFKIHVTPAERGVVTSLPSQEGGMAKVIEIIEELVFRVDALEKRMAKDAKKKLAE